jgi:hypothetical protein
VPPYKGSVPEYPAWVKYNIVFQKLSCCLYSISLTSLIVH